MRIFVDDRCMNTLERQKLFEAIGFFTQATKHCGLVKLFKLLYYLDMLHFRETGRPVTGLSYKALPYGPVPTSLYDEVQKPSADFSAAISVQSPPGDVTDEPARTIITPKKPLGTRHLTKRELRIASEVAEIFNEVNAKQISDVSHARNGPWDKAKKLGAGKWGIPIDYFDSINLDLGTGKGASLEELRERAADHAESRKHFA
jgi:uncharacterized phage-associated protein